jgi:hypothetical protein
MPTVKVPISGTKPVEYAPARFISSADEVIETVINNLRVHTGDHKYG